MSAVAHRDSEQFNEIAARVNAANAQLQQLANDPMIRQVAGVILAVVAASAVLYDWCASGKGYTAIDFEGTGERGSSNRDKKPEQSNPTKVDTKAEGSKKNEGGSSNQ